MPILLGEASYILLYYPTTHLIFGQYTDLSVGLIEKLLHLKCSEKNTMYSPLNNFFCFLYEIKTIFFTYYEVFFVFIHGKSSISIVKIHFFK